MVVSADEDTHYIFRAVNNVFPQVVFTQPLLLAANPHRVGLTLWNTMDAQHFIFSDDTLFQETNGSLLLAQRISATEPFYYVFQPPVPQNRLIIALNAATTGIVGGFETLLVRGHDYEAMREAVQGTGAIPVIGQRGL